MPRRASVHNVDLPLFGGRSEHSASERAWWRPSKTVDRQDLLSERRIQDEKKPWLRRDQNDEHRTGPTWW